MFVAQAVGLAAVDRLSLMATGIELCRANDAADLIDLVCHDEEKMILTTKRRN